LADVAGSKVELSQRNPRECDTMCVIRADCAKRNLLEHPIEKPFGVIGFS
jgi:hypothetical protein